MTVMEWAYFWAFYGHLTRQFISKNWLKPGPLIIKDKTGQRENIEDPNARIVWYSNGPKQSYSVMVC